MRHLRNRRHAVVRTPTEARRYDGAAARAGGDHGGEPGAAAGVERRRAYVPGARRARAPRLPAPPDDDVGLSRVSRARRVPPHARPPRRFACLPPPPPPGPPPPPTPP